MRAIVVDDAPGYGSDCDSGVDSHPRDAVVADADRPHRVDTDRLVAVVDRHSVDPREEPEVVEDRLVRVVGDQTRPRRCADRRAASRRGCCHSGVED